MKEYLSQDSKEYRDVELLLLSKGQPEFFRELISRYHSKFIRKAVVFLRDERDAEEAVQETFVKIYMHADSYTEQPGASFSSWGYAILRNECCKLYGKRKRQRVHAYSLHSEADEYIADENMITEFEHGLTVEYALSLIATLPQKLRVVAEGMLSGFSYKEISKQEGIEEGVVRIRFHRAKKTLQALHDSQ